MYPPGRIGTSASSQHPGGVIVALCDGSVRFVSQTINLQTWRDIGQRDDVEEAGDRQQRDPEIDRRDVVLDTQRTEQNAGDEGRTTESRLRGPPPVELGPVDATAAAEHET